MMSIAKLIYHKWEVEMFITEEEFGTCQGLNNALERLQNKTIEATLKLLPDIIMGLMVRTQGTEEAYAKFKQDHPEYAGKEKELRLAIEQIELDNGALDLIEVLERVPDMMAKIAMPIPSEQVSTPAEVASTLNGFI
jgi:hypothetical protein